MAVFVVLVLLFVAWTVQQILGSPRHEDVQP